jgi:hypothetical protein
VICIHPHRSTIARLLARFVLTKADLTTADSKDLLRTAISLGARADRMATIQWGVDHKLFTPIVEDTNLRQQLALGDARVLISPRGLNRIYNIDTIIAAIPQVLQSYPNAVFLLRDFNVDPVFRKELLR